MYLKINKKNKKIRENSIKLLFYKKFHQVNPKIFVPFFKKLLQITEKYLE